MSVSAQALIEKLEQLPPQQLAEVEDFIDYLTNKSRRSAAWERLLAIAPALEAAGVPPISMDEINAEIEAARAEHRAKAQAEKTPSAPHS